MKFLYAHLCDQAFLSVHQKMNVIGIFDHLKAEVFPATHPRCDIVMCLELTAADLGIAIPIKIVLVDADGVGLMETQITHTVPGPMSEWRATSAFVITCTNLQFNAPGDYELNIRVRDELVATLPLTLMQDVQAAKEPDSFF